MSAIDLNRGVECRFERVTGMEVYMYFDEPGKFFSAHGTPLPDSLAKSCGYDVEKLAKVRLKKERQAQAIAALDAEFAEGGAVNELVAEADGFKMIHIGYERYNVTDADANVLNPRALTRPEAEALFKAFAPNWDGAAKAETPAKAGKAKSATPTS